MLDTNICAFAMNNHPVVCSRFAAEYPFGLSISAITEAELWFGVENSAVPQKNEEKLRFFLMAVEILPFDTLAAHAKALGFTLITNNTREFERVEGLSIEDWLA
jgi:tRNA(fMet)-specific endonuclease VapC